MMKPAALNIALARNTPYLVHLAFVDAGGVAQDLTDAIITASAICDDIVSDLVCRLGDATGELIIDIPSKDHDCVSRWELWLQTSKMDACNQVAGGIITVQERVDSNNNQNPASHHYQLRLSDRVQVTINPVDLAWWAQLAAQEAANRAQSSLDELHNVRVGKVTTLPAGRDAEASFDGQEFNFAIPQGDQGERGLSGGTPYPGANGNWFNDLGDTGVPVHLDVDLSHLVPKTELQKTLEGYAKPAELTDDEWTLLPSKDANGIYFIK